MLRWARDFERGLFSICAAGRCSKVWSEICVNRRVGRILWVPSRTGVVAPLSKLEKVDGGFAFK